MLQVSEVYEEEQKLCAQLLEQVDWQSAALAEGIGELACKICGSQLLRPREKPDSVQDGVLLCSSCGAAEDSDSFIPRAVALALQVSAYRSIKDGGDTPYVDCPECGVEAYVMEENRCASCGTEIDTVCSRCGGEILPDELDCAPMCGWCAHMSSKDD